MKKNTIEPSLTTPKKITIPTSPSQKNISWLIIMRYFITQWAPNHEDERVKWLKERGILFDKYCLPSILPQLKESGGQCVLFITDGYELYLTKKTLDLVNDGVFKVIHASTIAEQIEKSSTLIKETQKKINSDSNDNNALLITRLDNDDALSLDYYNTCCEFYRNTQENINGRTISFIHGSQYNERNNEWYVYLFTNNHFLSTFIDSRSSVNLTGLFGNHSKLFINDKETITLTTQKPMWAEIIHEKNLANQMRSSIKTTSNIRERFLF